MPSDKSLVSDKTSRFLQTVNKTPLKRGEELPRLIFGMDATLSREPTWDQACQIQSEMFASTRELGGLAIQLCYFRGFMEFEAGAWCRDTAALQREMASVRCRGGYTQIARLLRHVKAQSKALKAAVFVGDAMEEDADEICHIAGELGLVNVPLFVFHEGHSPAVATTFRQMATLSGGAYAPFDISSAGQLRALLGAAAVYAAGGNDALRRLTRNAPALKSLTRQLK